MSEVNGELIHEVIRLEDLEDEKAKERVKGEIFFFYSKSITYLGGKNQKNNEVNKYLLTNRHYYKKK